MTTPPPSLPLTHLALRVADMDASIEFYRRYAGWLPVQEREDNGTRVCWLADAACTDDPPFVLVLMRMDAEPSPRPRPVDHLGFCVPARQDVDRLAELARNEGRLVLGPEDWGPVVGYICEVTDPDGNVCEFSHGQTINPRRRSSPT